MSKLRDDQALRGEVRVRLDSYLDNPGEHGAECVIEGLCDLFEAHLTQAGPVTRYQCPPNCLQGLPIHSEGCPNRPSTPPQAGNRGTPGFEAWDASLDEAVALVLFRAAGWMTNDRATSALAFLVDTARKGSAPAPPGSAAGAREPFKNAIVCECGAKNIGDASAGMIPVYVTDSLEASKPVAFFRYGDQAVKWAGDNYADRYQVGGRAPAAPPDSAAAPPVVTKPGPLLGGCPRCAHLRAMLPPGATVECSACGTARADTPPVHAPDSAAKGPTDGK